MHFMSRLHARDQVYLLASVLSNSGQWCWISHNESVRPTGSQRKSVAGVPECMHCALVDVIEPINAGEDSMEVAARRQIRP